MPIRIPANQTVESKYTSGKEYMFASTQNEYNGPYYEMNGKTFAGEKFDPSNPEIIKIQSDKYNSLLGKAATYLYGRISGVKLVQTKISSLPEGGGEDVQHANSIPKEVNPNYASFYCKKINNDIIKKIDESTYVSLQKNPLYQTTYLGVYNGVTQTTDMAETQMPGITDWTTSDIRGF